MATKKKDNRKDYWDMPKGAFKKVGYKPVPKNKRPK